MTKIVLTGDRPSGRLHIGHYVGSLQNRVKLQMDEKLKQYVFIADLQALTDNVSNSLTINEKIMDVAIDYLSVGIDPSKTTIFIQSMIPELSELTVLLMNFVTLSRLQRNPTVKEEIKNKKFGNSIPTSFLVYPISQAADILCFKADIIPVGEDQNPLIEQTREIVNSFNSIYGEVFKLPTALVSESKISRRLPGIDGQSKMGKSLGNAIYLSDSKEVVDKKILSMYTDPNHLKVSDPGNTSDNPVFQYLDAFAQDKHFELFNVGYKNLDDMKDHYERGGLGDVVVKKFLASVINHELNPIRSRRKYFEDNKQEVIDILVSGSADARLVAQQTLIEVKEAMNLIYW